MHTLVWYFTLGKHDPAWVQAAASVAVVALSVITLAVLFVYAWDTHTLAKTSAEQMQLMKKDRDAAAMRNYHAALDCFLKVQVDLTTVLQSIADHSFGTKLVAPVYPNNWPDVTAALLERVPNTAGPSIRLSIRLRRVDSAVSEFFNAADNDDKRTSESKVTEALIYRSEQRGYRADRCNRSEMTALLCGAPCPGDERVHAVLSSLHPFCIMFLRRSDGGVP